MFRRGRYVSLWWLLSIALVPPPAAAVSPAPDAASVSHAIRFREALNFASEASYVAASFTDADRFPEVEAGLHLT